MIDIKEYNHKCDKDIACSGVSVSVTGIKLCVLFGFPEVIGYPDEQTQREWLLSVESDGQLYGVDIYDYKEYRSIKATDKINYHIGITGGYANRHIAQELKDYIESRCTSVEEIKLLKSWQYMESDNECDEFDEV